MYRFPVVGGEKSAVSWGGSQLAVFFILVFLQAICRVRSVSLLILA